ncbi:GNAT family N-acetyltransferase [bacterium]|nr:GNAT family N-acetyltransferase [bacterium]
MKAIVDSGETPGILAYEQDTPIAWCSIAPRECFSVLQRSRILKPVDNESVWSVSCFFVAKSYRRRGITAELLRGAVSYAKHEGARIVEGYPIDARKPNYPVIFAWTGFYPAFKKAGFNEALRRSETRPIMRFIIKG